MDGRAQVKAGESERDGVGDGEDGGTPGSGTGDLGPADPRVVEFFGAALPQVALFAQMLADEGVRRGLIGPRELPRLWERHLVNSGTVASLLPERGTVVDVGSGAGLPGIVLGAMRPDLEIVLLEPMARRVAWLDEVITALALSSVRVHRGRAEELHGTLLADAVTARAVAPMDRLATWTLPLLKVGGELLAMKGGRAADELADASDVISAGGGAPGEIVDAAAEGLPGTIVVRVVRTSEGTVRRPTRSRRSAEAGSRNRERGNRTARDQRSADRSSQNPGAGSRTPRDRAARDGATRDQEARDGTSHRKGSERDEPGTKSSGRNGPGGAPKSRPPGRGRG